MQIFSRKLAWDMFGILSAMLFRLHIAEVGVYILKYNISDILISISVCKPTDSATTWLAQCLEGKVRPSQLTWNNQSINKIIMALNSAH